MEGVVAGPRATRSFSGCGSSGASLCASLKAFAAERETAFCLSLLRLASLRASGAPIHTAAGFVHTADRAGSAGGVGNIAFKLPRSALSAYLGPGRGLSLERIEAGGVVGVGWAGKGRVFCGSWVMRGRDRGRRFLLCACAPARKGGKKDAGGRSFLRRRWPLGGSLVLDLALRREIVQQIAERVVFGNGGNVARRTKAETRRARGLAALLATIDRAGLRFHPPNFSHKARNFSTASRCSGVASPPGEPLGGSAFALAERAANRSAPCCSRVSDTARR